MTSEYEMSQIGFPIGSVLAFGRMHVMCDCPRTEDDRPFFHEESTGTIIIHGAPGSTVEEFEWEIIPEDSYRALVTTWADLQLILVEERTRSFNAGAMQHVTQINTRAAAILKDITFAKAPSIEEQAAEAIDEREFQKALEEATAAHSSACISVHRIVALDKANQQMVADEARFSELLAVDPAMAARAVVENDGLKGLSDFAIDELISNYREKFGNPPDDIVDLSENDLPGSAETDGATVGGARVPAPPTGETPADTEPPTVGAKNPTPAADCGS